MKKKDIKCNGNWFRCRAGWIGKCVDSFKCMKNSIDKLFGEGTYDKTKF